MSLECPDKQWGFGKLGATSDCVGSIVCDIGEPCLYQSPIKVVVAVNKMLKPEKWQASFDGDGKILGFEKALKLIILGGVDPSIRPEVWEFLLGCYTLTSTAESRRQLRTARRERYEELVKACQRMHSSVGTGCLAYVVGSKVMDMRRLSKDDGRREAEVEVKQAVKDNTYPLNDRDHSNNCTDTTYTCQRESLGDSSDLVSVRESIDSAEYESSCAMPSPARCDQSNLKQREAQGSQYAVQSYFDFPALPVTNLFEKNDDVGDGCQSHNDRHSAQSELGLKDCSMHSFQINNNEDLVIESNGLPSNGNRRPTTSEIEILNSYSQESKLQPHTLMYKGKLVNRLRISDMPDTPAVDAGTSQIGPNEDRVSEWLWTLHRIVVDVVRTDSHLEFYADPKNLARMSDILAVYAWVDPETGYCQGMSDLLSPFVVLFEDDADAFWCFETFLRRRRENFRMEGQTGVMKQLQTLWHILKLTDRGMFSHLSHIGAESLHFAFRMLLVLFRRELSFSEALCMWEMMWAADFHESLACNLEQNCLGSLALQLPVDSCPDNAVDKKDCDASSSKNGSIVKHADIEHSVSGNCGMKSISSAHSFCGLTRNFWSRNGRMPIRTGLSEARNGEDELPVFCVAAILILNRHKIMKETHSIDDLIKIFNDNLLKIQVKRCIHTAIKLRKKYFYKLIRSSSPPLESDNSN